MHSENRKLYGVVSWLICGLGALYYSYEYLLRIAPSAMADSLQSHFNLTATGFGLLSSVYYYAYVPMQLPVGVLLDRYGPRRLLTLACLICVLGTFLFTASSLFWVAALGRFAVGFGSAFAFVGVLKLATIWLPEDRLAMMSGLAAALGTLGAMLGDNLLDFFVQRVGWVTTLNVTAAFGIILVILLWLGIRDKRDSSEPAGTLRGFKQGVADLKIITRNKQFWINGLFGCLVYLPTTVFGELWGIPYLTHAHHLSPASAGWAVSLLFLGFTIGAPLNGYISDRLRRRITPMLTGAVGAFIIMTMILYLPNLTESGIQSLMFLLGLFYSVQSIVFAVAREISPNEAAATAMALANMVVMVAAMILQPLIGRLLDLSLTSRIGYDSFSKLSIDNLQKMYTLHDYRLALFAIPLGIFIAAILTFFIKETHAKASYKTEAL